MRSPLLRASLALALLGPTACGGDDLPTPAPSDTPDAGFASPDAGGPPPLPFGLHYHRPDGRYDGWQAELSGAGLAAPRLLDATETTGFGAYFPFDASGLGTVRVRFLSAGTADPADGFEVDLTAASGGVWWFSGGERPLLRAPGGIPGPDQVVVYYKRKDADYASWGLHLWGDVAQETLWIAPKRNDGIDPELGAFFLVDVKPGAERVNLIVHIGDTKDPGPDMGFDISEIGRFAFVLSGSTRIWPHPVDIPEFAIVDQAAHWIDRDTLAWSFEDQPATRFELRTSTAAEIRVEGTEVVGGRVLPLRLDAAGLSMDQRARWPHLRQRKALRLDPSVDLATREAALRGQLVAVARDDAGKALSATLVQIPGVLDDLFAWDGPLGARFDGRRPSLSLWAPTAQRVRLEITPSGGSPQLLDMQRGARGVWTSSGAESWYGGLYRYEVTVYHPVSQRVETAWVTDPYSVSLGAGSRRSHLVDLADPALAPPGWDALEKPSLEAPEDTVIYELHVRDFSANDPTVPAEHRGKFLAFTHDGSQSSTASAGMRHLRALARAGLTTLHLLPSFDIATVNENASERVELDDGFDRLCARNPMVPRPRCTEHGTTKIRDVLAAADPSTPAAQEIVGWMRNLDGFNWGYDPFHYTVPEGSYATDPEGSARILELRAAVAALARSGLRVALDVVYNHTNGAGLSDTSVLDKIVPGYYHRLNSTTGFIESSTCCQNTATEHVMMERLMLDSLETWAVHYKIDAFRFDLMGHHMKANMERVRDRLHALTPAAHGVDGSKIYLYGEGWDFGEVVNGSRGANASQINMFGTGIGTFNDRIRDAVRGGGPFDSGEALRANQGFFSGLGYAPNEASPAEATTRERALNAQDLIRIGLAGNLRDFPILDRTGGRATGRFVPYNGEPAGYTSDPQESVTYVSKHDNQTLWDIGAYKQATGTPTADRVRAHVLALATTAWAQGVPFFHAGVELLRSKSMERDSYDSGDWFNRLDYSYASNHWNVGLPNAEKDEGNWPTIRPILADATTAPSEVHIRAAAAAFQEVIAVRKSTRLLRLRTAEEITRRVDFHNVGPSQSLGLIAMSVTDGRCAGDDLDPDLQSVVVILNARPDPASVTISGAGAFVLHPVLESSADPITRQARFASGRFEVPARTAAVFVEPQAGAQGDGLACNTR